jgi:Cu-processing system permease protein
MENTILIIAKKEFMDNVRNSWILFASTLFALLAVIVSLMGSWGGHGWQDFQLTINAMMPLVQYLIPLLGLLLGYETITGEIEKGSMNSLLALPTNRKEIVLGKFIGLSVVISFAIVLGFSVAGGIIAFNIPNPNVAQYAVFIAVSMLTGIVFVGLAILISVFFVRRSTAVGGTIFFWFFFTFLLDALIKLLTVVIAGLDNLVVRVPEWYFTLNLCNPTYDYVTIIGLTVPTTSTTHTLFSGEYPSFFSPGLMAVLLLAWIIIFLAIALFLFERRDI